MTIISQFTDITSSSKFLTRRVSLAKFHVSIITGSGVMTIFVYKGLNRKPEIGNTSVWVLPNIWRLRGVRDTKCGKNVSNGKSLNNPKCQGYIFYRFWVIKGRPTGAGQKYRPILIRVNSGVCLSTNDLLLPPGIKR